MKMSDEKFEQLLIEKNLTRKELANELGLNHNFVKSWGENILYPVWIEDYLKSKENAKREELKTPPLCAKNLFHKKESIRLRTKKLYNKFISLSIEKY